jgi:MHS family proline/betaine transporter-like MFS transporter
MMAPDDLERWGWRIPFALGAMLAAGIWLARSGMPETPLFLQQQGSAAATPPLRHVLRQERPAILRSFAISALGSITYYVGITYVPAYLQTVGWRDNAQALGVSTLAAVVVIAVTPLVGLMSDRHGRKPMLLVLCAGSVVLPGLMFRLMAGGEGLVAVLGALVLAALAGGVSAVGAVATAEQFPVHARLSGLAIGATGATAIFGGLAPYIAHMLLQATHRPEIPGVLIAVVALSVMPVLIRAPETAERTDAGP